MVKGFNLFMTGATNTAKVAGLTVAFGLSGVLSTVSAQDSNTEASNTPMWMMGEVHDNAQGHFYRLKDLESNLGGDWRPAILMEQFNVNQQKALTDAWQTCKTAQCVINTAGGVKGWDWDLYKPLISLALKYELPLVAANLSNAQVKAVMKDGFGAVFDDETIKAYKLDQPLPQPWLDNQRKLITKSHCNALPADAIDPMVKAQAARDVKYAQLMQEYSTQGAVLIAGNGHVRRDLGVMQWLPANLASRVKVSGYVEPSGIDALLYDVMRVVEPQKRPDPCAALKKGQKS